MRQDGRGFDHRTLESIRLMAVERVRDGERPSSVIASFGFNRTTIYRWLNAASKPGVGLSALRSRPATGRPRRLTPRQEQQVFRWVNGRDPRQHGLDFGLWTRRLVAELIERKFGIRLGVTAVGELLAKLGLTPQKPLQRAYQRDPEAIERWQREQFPAIAREAKAIAVGQDARPQAFVPSCPRSCRARQRRGTLTHPRNRPRRRMRVLVPICAAGDIVIIDNPQKRWRASHHRWRGAL